MTHTTERDMIPKTPQDADEITAEALGAQLAPQDAPEADTQQEQTEQEARMDEIRAGIGELFEDGWTAQELSQLAADPLAQEAIAKGHGVARAACAYLRAKMHARRHSVPTARTIATGATARDNPIEHMSDEQFDAFSRRARAAMMAGQKVRM